MSRRLMILLAVLALAVGVLTPVAAGAEAAPELVLAAGKGEVAKSPTGSYIVVMKEAPLIAEFGQDGLDSRQAKAEKAAKQGRQDRVLRESGASESDKVNSYTAAVDGFSAIVSHKEAQAMANRDDVLAVYPDELRQPTTDSSPTFLRLDDPAGPWAAGLDGEGVVIGVIDTGIWPEHPSFADDGSYAPPPVTIDDVEATEDSPFIAGCDFGNTAHNPNDAAFTCNNKLIGARQMLATYRALVDTEFYEYDSARDEDGHGTHTASTAGGNAGVQASIFGVDRGIVSGVAPRAHIVMYKGLGDQGGFGSDLAAAIDQAVADGVDVINYSIGSSSFAIGPDDVAFLFAANAGVLVATSAGNSGPNPETLGSPSSVPWLTTVGASTQARTFQGSAELGDGTTYFGASVTNGTDELKLVDAALAGDELCNIGSLDPAVVAGNIVLCKRGAIARVDKSRAVSDAGGAGMILYNANDAQSEVTDNHWVPSVHISFTLGAQVKAYVTAEGDDATATINGGVYTPIDGSVMASFSSRGPNELSADIIKPDVTAPGVNILAGNAPVPDGFSPPESGAPGQSFQAISGTSMSSPHVAGVFALIKQAHPDWSAAMAKSALMTTARQDVTKEDGKTKADPFDMGAGHIVAVSQGNQGSPFDPGLVFDTGLYEYAAFTCGANLGVFDSGTCEFLEAIGLPMDPSDLNVPSIGIADLVGSQTVTRTLTNVSSTTRSFQASVEKPHGYTVSVSPKKLRLAPGEVATVEITITNKKARIGAWAFGSVTWHGGGYQVSSPIAVKAALFSAATEVFGSGEDGSASFEVTFGYAGSYTAAGHGLEPATVTHDTVVQDPDQLFNPNDGFSNRHDFELDGSAYFKVAIPPDAVASGNIDLDVFVYDPDGNLVGASTNGATNEAVGFLDPADGTWSVYVHGWQTGAGPADYDMYSWEVPGTSGGSLNVDSAPETATVGSTETIEVSWTGAVNPDWYLGAVSHTGEVGLMGVTLVDVDNR